VLAGVQSWQRMSMDLLPSLDVPVVNIITHLEGASPDDIDQLITRPMVAGMQSIHGVNRVSSTSAQGISDISVQFSWGTSVEEARQRVQSNLARIAGQLPQGVTPRLEQIGTTLQEVASYTITSPDNPAQLLNDIRYKLLPRLTQLSGVSRIDVLGGKQRSFMVRIKPQALIALHLRLSDISQAIQAINHVQVAGFVHEGGREWVVASDGRIQTLHDLQQLSIQTAAMQHPVHLGDIADVEEGFVSNHYVIHGNGKPAVALLVRKQMGANALDVVKELDANMHTLKSLLPAGSEIHKVYDQAEIIARAKGEIMQDLWLGSILVVLVLYLFLGSIRPTLVVATTIPITLLATLAMMQWMGLSLNIVTMTALALVIGMIVDDAIIVAENIVRHRLTSSPEESALQGTLEIAAPDTSGTLTTISAFLPLLLMTGIAALFLRPFAWTVSIALVVSLLLSLFFVPALSASKLFSSAMHTPAWIIYLQVKMNQLFVWSMDHRRSFFTAILMLLLVAALLAAKGRASLLPPMDEGSILIEYIMPPGTSLQESNRMGNELEHIALQQDEVVAVYRRTGSPMVGYQIEGPHRGEMMIKLKPISQRKYSADDMMNRFRHLYSPYTSMSFLFHNPTQEKMDESFSGLPALFGVTIYGNDSNTLIALSQQVETMLKKNPAISNIVNNTSVRSNQLVVHLNSTALAMYGLSPSDVRQALRAAGLGVQATTVVHQQENIPVLLHWKHESMQHPDQIADIPIVTAKGGWVPLKRVAKIEMTSIASSVTRLNGQRQMTLLAEADGNLMTVASDVQTALNQMTLPKGYSAVVSGQYPVIMATIKHFAVTALLAVALIYMLMVLQLGSWKQPLAILTAIPISLAGGLIAVLLTGHGLDASIAMGALTLIGIAVNNGLVLINEANRHISLGMQSMAAWQEAITLRLRPILMTVVITIVSLLPILAGIGGASEIFQPFAWMVLGGLITGLVGSLMILPLLLAQAVKG